MSVVKECPMSSDRHLSFSGGPADPYQPHAHPFGPTQGLVALCSRNADCRIEGHITRGDDGYKHIAADVVVPQQRQGGTS